MKKNYKKWIFTILLCIMAVFLIVPSYQAQAASAKTKALKAYSKMLSKKKIRRDSATVFKRANTYFAIAYIDNDSIPELILYNSTDACHAQRYGALYTYRKGKVKLVTVMSLDDRDRMGYYKKTGWFTDNSTWTGYGTDTIQKLSKGRIMQNLSYYRSTYDNGYRVAIEGYGIRNNGNSTEVDGTTFNRSLSYNTKNKRFTKFKFYKNTKANRKKYLK